MVEVRRREVAHVPSHAGAWRIAPESRSEHGGTLIIDWCRSCFWQVDQVLVKLMVRVNRCYLLIYKKGKSQTIGYSMEYSYDTQQVLSVYGG